MFAVHVSIHAEPAGVEAAQPIDLMGVSVQPLIVTSEQNRLPMAISFEQAVESLSLLPRMYVEPDGSFVWASQEGWQLDGNLYDHQEHLVMVEMKGGCDAPSWNQLLDCLGNRQQRLMVQLVQQAVFLKQEEFLKWWGCQGESSAQ